MHGKSNLLDTHFSRTLIFTCFFIGLINNQMFTSEPNVHHKLLISQLGKLSNIVINYTCLLFLSNTFYINFSKREWLLKVFERNFQVVFIDRLHFTAKFLVTSQVFQTAFLFKSCFKFTSRFLRFFLIISCLLFTAVYT